MNDQTVTFDFHNTLAECPEWFDLEVKHLPSSFLTWWAGTRGGFVSPGAGEEADGRYRQLRHEIIDHGNELTAEESLRVVFGAMNIPVPEPAIKEGVEALMRGALTGASPVAGAVESVRTLHRSGVSIGVVSSAVYHPFLEWTLEKFGICHLFRVIVTSASAGFYKSRPEIYLHAADALGADPSRVVHIGDSLRFDVGGARRAGMGTVWLKHDPNTMDDGTIVPDLTLLTLEASSPAILHLLGSRGGNA